MMQMSKFAFAATDWTAVPQTQHAGETGMAYWRTLNFGDIRVRFVEYSAGYLADHWCEKGHILLCVEGELETELKDGRVVTLKPGMTYQVGDGVMAHRSRTRVHTRLFIVD
jgi:hypothetical protein